MGDIVRVLRLIEYVGDREWVESSLERRQIKGSWICPNGTIREAIVGDFPMVVGDTDEGDTAP